jgi:signal transduction histidine kinase
MPLRIFLAHLSRGITGPVCAESPKAQANRLTHNPRKLNLFKICDEISESLKIRTITKNISIHNNVSEEITVFADINLLKTILRNLISNAIKFTNQNGQISIYAKHDNANVTISISDTGIGIAPEYLIHLFDISPLHTTDENTVNEKGTGLGLYLCKECVEKHGGKIWAESELGKGSTFSFTLNPIEVKPTEKAIL